MDALAWPSANQLTIAFSPVPKGYRTQKSRLVNAAINIAMAQINGLGSAVTLRRVGYTEDPDIALRPSLFLEHEAVHGEAGLPDGERIGAGYVFVEWDESQQFTSATILIAQNIGLAEINSIVLEEMAQSLGFLFDIENPDYENVSIFAQDSNLVFSLTGQDAAMVRLYYPVAP